MRELREILAALEGPERDVAVLASVVRAEGSTYRRPGDTRQPWEGGLR